MSRRRRRKKSSGLPANQSPPADRAALIQTEERQLFSGPLPPPEILHGYDDIHPGAADRIIRMAEKEQQNAQDARMLAIRKEAADTRRGQIIGGIVSVSAFLTAAFLGYHGHPYAASIVGGATVVGLVTVFVTGRRSSSS